LGQGDQLWGASVGIEGQGAVLFGEAEVFGDLGSEGGAVGFFLEEFGVYGGGLGVVGICCGLRVLTFPAFGGVQVYEVEGDLLFVSSSFGTDVVDHVADDTVAHDDLVAAVLENEAGAVRSRAVGLQSGGVLRQSVERLWHADGDGEESCSEFCGAAWMFHRVIPQFRRRLGFARVELSPPPGRVGVFCSEVSSFVWFAGGHGPQNIPFKGVTHKILAINELHLQDITKPRRVCRGFSLYLHYTGWRGVNTPRESPRLARVLSI